MTTIGIIGMGRMGQAISSVLESRKDITIHSFKRLSPAYLPELKKCQVAIEFTIPEAAPEVIRTCIQHQVPIVSGTTGWHEYQLSSILSFCKEKQGTLLYATNFSIGMNIVFALNQKLASVMSSFPEFKPSIREVHHIHKKDSPSGTAYTLIENILDSHPDYKGFMLNPQDSHIPDDRFPVTAVREGDVKGLHEVTWNSGLEKIFLAHEAFDRRIFAEGAVMAAEWLARQHSGAYTMRDIIHL